MDEFFPPKLKEGETLAKSGRSWSAAELRLKSFEDLHRLWFVCLKERNMLLSDRLYFQQVGQSAPDGSRLQKVKATMRCIKVVLGERQRAEAAYAADQARLAKLNETDKDKLQAAQAILASAEGSAAATPEATKTKGKGAAKEATVTFKRFGRKYTVPESLAPEKPTRQQTRRGFKSRLYFRNLKQRTEEVLGKAAAVQAAAERKGQSVGGPAVSTFAHIGSRGIAGMGPAAPAAGAGSSAAPLS